MTLQIRNENTQPPNDHEMMVYHTMAKHAVESKFYKGIGDQAAVMMIMLSARELGISPMMALNGGLNIIQGKVELSARVMSAMIRRAGHSIKVMRETANECIIKGVRADNGDSETCSFSVDEAKQAGIFKSGGGWTKWPKDMCFARALSRLSRRLFSDVIGTAYIEGEIQDNGNKPVRNEAEIVHEIEPEPELAPSGYLQNFAECDHQLAMEYLKVVCDHFSWDPTAGIRELMKDTTKLKEKFSAWKSKREQDNAT